MGMSTRNDKMTTNNIRGVEKGHSKKPMALGWTWFLKFLSNRGTKILRVEGVEYDGADTKKYIGDNLGTKVKNVLYFTYIFELGIIRKYGRKDVGDVGKASKKIALR